MIPLQIEFRGLNELIADFERAQAKLSQGFEEPLRRTRDALWQAVRELFASGGVSTTHGSAPRPWAPWSPLTESLRENRLGYYDQPGPVQNTIGVWTNEMLEAMSSDHPPGFSLIDDESLEMGIDPIGGIGVKWIEFIQGRKTPPVQPEREVYENLHAEEVTLDVFANWLHDEVPIFQQAESDQSEYLGLS